MTTKFLNSVTETLEHEVKRKPHEGKSDVVFYGHFSGNDIFYVGIGYPSRPYSKYRSDLWKRHVAKYGYRTVILLKNLTWNEACLIEKEFIKTLGKKYDGTGILVNMTDGGEGARGLKQSEARKEYMRNLFKGKPCS
mgnify:CR=1 FL=1